jgi:hypothetical protein
MIIHQRDIIDVNCRLPGGSFKPHPVLVLSNDTVYLYEEAFIGVMISGSDVSDSFSFPLTY